MSLESLLSTALGANFKDVRGTIYRSQSRAFGSRPLSGLTMLAIHHTVGPKSQTWDAIARFHVDTNGWPGIGYHLGIRQGVLTYLGDASQARACCLNQNHRVLCLVLTGDYQTAGKDSVSAEDAALLRRTVGVIQAWAVATLGRKLQVVGHKEVPGQQTACPGVRLLPLVHELAGQGPAAPPAPPAPGPSTGPNFGKVAWAIEEAVRILEREGRTDSAAFIRSNYLKDAIARRDGR